VVPYKKPSGKIFLVLETFPICSLSHAIKALFCDIGAQVTIKISSSGETGNELSNIIWKAIAIDLR